MRKIKYIIMGGARPFTKISLIFLTALMAFGLMGCDSALDVTNINNLVEDDLTNPIAANGIANGALARASEGIGYVIAPFLTATDEVTWIGSRDAWRELDFGNIAFTGNEFVDDAMKYMHEGRWMADKAVILLSQFDQDGTLPDQIDLARAHLYAALNRVYIADWFDDWAFSDKTVASTNVGQSAMNSVYNDAIASMEQALSIAQAEGDTDLQTRIIALRARTRHALAIWGLLNPKGTTPANPYVNAGKADAETALGMMGDDTYRWQLFFAPGAERNDYSFEVNSRLELGIVADPNMSKPELIIAIMDPLDNIADPRVLAEIIEFKDSDRWNGDNYAPVTVVSAKEMRLIIAEAELAAGNRAAAIAQLDAIRAMDGLSAVPDARLEEMLQHERRACLFMMGRRLADMYRFGIQSNLWQSTSDAINTPGTFLPITIGELSANPLIDPNK